LGNDSIIIAFVERGGQYGVHTLASQTVMVHVIVEPRRSDVYQVSLVYTHHEQAAFASARQLPVKQLVLSSALVAYVRELCLVADLSCQHFLHHARGAQTEALFGNQEQRCQQIMVRRRSETHCCVTICMIERDDYTCCVFDFV
jgi:hypothetical protein